MNNHILTLVKLYLSLFILWGCGEQRTPSNKAIKFTIVDIHITVNGVKNIQNCANWYIDFSRIKKTVVYKDKIICIGLNGGFACLNSSNLKQDTVLENRLNTDFYTKATVYQDTLFAEKFDKIFYLNSADKWVKYLHPLPIKYFDLLLEDKSYAIYSTCGGEFGSILLAYNKTTGKTRGELTTCPNSVVKTNLGYYVGTHLYHMSGWSGSYIIKDIEKLKLVPEMLRNIRTMFYRDPRFTFLKDTNNELRSNYLPFEFCLPRKLKGNSSFSLYDDMMISASFTNNGKMYHIIDPRDFHKEDVRYIGSVFNDTLNVIDILKNCNPKTVYQFGNTTIINEEFYGEGFTMIRNDTIFKITFKTLHPDYHGPKLEGYNLSTDQSKKVTANLTHTNNLNEKNNWKAKPGQPEREIDFRFRGKYRIVGKYGDGVNGNYIFANNHKTKIKFQNQENFIEKIFIYDDRLFLFFGNSGSIENMYGLIEITDVDNFAKKYKE